MAQRPEDRPTEPKMDPKSLYREEIITDRKVGTIRVLTPIKSDGSSDASRAITYIGEAQLLTSVGTLPINFEIEAQSLDEAVKKFAEVAKDAVERTVKDLQELVKRNTVSMDEARARAANKDMFR